MHVDLTWDKNMEFTATPPSGVSITFDTHPDHGGTGAGPTPLETLLCSIAACTAMDVLSILLKKKQKIESYRVEVEGERDEPGEWPRPFKKITVRHLVRGENLDEAAVARAVALSDEKYCSVSATLRYGPELVTTWQLN